MRYNTIDSKLFIYNRKRLFSKLPNNCIAVFNSNDIMPTNGDGVMPFKQNSDLFYLTGIDQEETALILVKDKNGNKNTHLFIKETSEIIAIWEGNKLNIAEASKISGIEPKQIFYTTKITDAIYELMMFNPTVYYNSNEHARATKEVETRDDRFLKQFKKQYKSATFEKVAPFMHELRLIKSETEIDLIKHACSITKKGFDRILPFIKPGIKEYEIEAELIHEFIKNGSKGFAYQPIIASGANACVLHYIENDKTIKKGDLILMDVAAEYGNYNSDLTRCVPANGKFTARQKQVYNAVLRIFNQAKTMLVEGTILKEYNIEIGKIVESELIGLGLLSKKDIANQDSKNPAYRKYFMHGTSHYLGLDVHDVGSYDTPLKNGMVLTCEPGIYIPNENLGIRLENNFVINNNSPFDLMSNIAIDPDEIESLMN